MSKLPVAVQVYSVRDDAQADFAGTMKKIKAMGYDGVELAGMYGQSAQQIRAILDQLGLVCISAHVPYQEMTTDIDRVVSDYKTMGCEYIAIPYLGEGERPGDAAFAGVIENIRIFGAKCKAAGITLLYHNHDFEFIRLPNGEYGLDDLYTQVSADLLQTEIDTCWVKVAGEDPAQYIRKYAGRCPVVHLKDFYKSGGKADDMYELIGIEKEKQQSENKAVFEFRPVGHGMQDFPSILAASLESGAKWVVVEQDSSVDCPPIEAIEKSRKYLASLGW